MPRAESETQHAAIGDKFTSLESLVNTKFDSIEKTMNEKSSSNATRLTTIEGKGQGMGQMVGWISLGIGVVISLVEVARFFVK